MWGLILELKFRGKYESQKLKENKNENDKVMLGTLVHHEDICVKNALNGLKRIRHVFFFKFSKFCGKFLKQF